MRRTSTPGAPSDLSDVDDCAPCVTDAVPSAIPSINPSQLSSNQDASPSSGRTVKKKIRRVILNTSRTRYDVVRDAGLAMGYIIEDDGREMSATAEAKYALTDKQRGYLKKIPHYDPDLHSDLIWVDTSVLQQRVSKLKAWQRINHFPMMHLIARKVNLFVRLMKHRAMFPDLYNFFPLSWSLKTEVTALKDYLQSLRGKLKTFVVKPNGGCQGRGIVLTRSPLKVASGLPDQDYTVQLYVHRPMLIEGRKFDMRVYVLVTSVAPELRVFVHKEGLVRICAEPYEKPRAGNLKHAHVHLTNYAVNKDSANFVRNDEEGDIHGDTGNKRDFDFLKGHVEAEHGPNGWRDLVRRIDRAVVLTLLTAGYELKQTLESCNLSGAKGDGRCCFELLGFDVMVNQDGEVFVIEVNHSPSLFTDSPLDHRIKLRVLTDTFGMLDPFVMANHKKQSDFYYEKHVGLGSTKRAAEGSREATNWRQAYPHLEEPGNHTLAREPLRATAPTDATNSAEGEQDASAAASAGEDPLQAALVEEERQEYENTVNDVYAAVLRGTSVSASVSQMQLMAIMGRNTRAKAANPTTSGGDVDPEEEDEEEGGGEDGDGPEEQSAFSGVEVPVGAMTSTPRAQETAGTPKREVTPPTQSQQEPRPVPAKVVRQTAAPRSGPLTTSKVTPALRPVQRTPATGKPMRSGGAAAAAAALLARVSDSSTTNGINGAAKVKPRSQSQTRSVPPPTSAPPSSRLPPPQQQQRVHTGPHHQLRSADARTASSVANPSVSRSRSFGPSSRPGLQPKSTISAQHQQVVASSSPPPKTAFTRHNALAECSP